MIFFWGLEFCGWNFFWDRDFVFYFWDLAFFSGVSFSMMGFLGSMKFLFFNFKGICGEKVDRILRKIKRVVRGRVVVCCVLFR